MSARQNDERAKGSGRQGRGPSGPRGGKTTRTGRGGVKKNLWIPADLNEQLREEAFQRRVPEAELIRQALRMFLRMVVLAVLLQQVLGEGDRANHSVVVEAGDLGEGVEGAGRRTAGDAGHDVEAQDQQLAAARYCSIIAATSGSKPSSAGERADAVARAGAPAEPGLRYAYGA